MAFTYVAITRTFKDAEGQAAAGAVVFTPITPMLNDLTVVKKAVTATLSNVGVLSQLLAANTDPGTVPTGTTYRVDERITGQSTLTYYIQVPHDQGSTIDLRDLSGWQGSTGGGGAVSSVNGVDPDIDGEVTLSATDVGAQPADGDLTGLAGLGDGVPRRASGTWGLVTGTPDGTKFLRDDGTWASASGSSYTSENARDDIAAALVAGSNVTITPNDGADTITISAASTGSSGIPASTVDAKGDLIAGTADDTVARRSVGTNGQALLADSAQTTGLAWGAPAPATHNHAGADITSGTVGTARLGSGTANSTSFLRGDQTWAAAWDIEQSQDAAASLFTTGTHTGISFSYDDTNGKVNATASAAGPVIIPSLTLGSTGAAASNTTAITSAITSAASGGKAVMLVGQGTCWVNATITVSAGVRLTVDLGITLKCNNPASGNDFIELAAGSVLDGFGKIDGNRSAAPTAGNQAVIVSGAGAVIKDVTVQQSVSAGIHISPAADSCMVVNTKVFDTGSTGIVAVTSGTTSAADYTLIQGNRVERPGRLIVESLGSEGAGIKTVGDDTTHVMGPEGVRIIGNDVIDAGGISIEVFGYGRAMTIANNHTKGGPWGISVDACQDVTVTGNTCVGHTTMGIEWANAQHGTCVGNTIDGRTTQSGGISITNPFIGGNQYLTVAHNVVRNIKTSTTGHSCINIQDASNLVIGPGNVLEAPSNGYGVRIQRLSTVDGGINMTTLKVQGNFIVGADTGVVVFNDGDNLTDVQQLVFENNTFKTMSTGLWFTGEVAAGAGGVANVYGSGNKFISVSTPKTGTVSGINDWQSNYPRTVNN